ncbi:hypothetical protein GCM10018793_31010 [Streptomyces sulfonofaciens]|uniref:Uncharacterized protein n=1 Tax=Streptomyces sulfonofaciens TaxID=68272 RepID=A0A919G8B1_9ACTN|nr:hypothetical protein [Streptomyces sulfonofaciens]GHH79110.1 hypothetical protein GCM10018793_31010 [Streptomyces sulfonofaciens]
MLLLGLLLAACTAAFAGLLISFNTGGGPDYTVTLLGNTPFTINTLGAFVGGICLTLLFGLGLGIMMAGASLMRRHRGQRLGYRRHARQATAERDAMARRLPETGAPHEEGSTSYTTRRRPFLNLHRPHLRH